MITRTFTTYKATAKNVEWKDGKPVAKEIGSCIIEGTTPTKTEIRKMMRNKGIEIKRGTNISIEKISERILGMDEETFVKYAEEITREVQQG